MSFLVGNTWYVSVGDCCRCKTDFAIPQSLYDAAMASPEIWFYCPYGHKQHYSKDRSERLEDQLRRERDRLKQNAARLADEIEYQRQQREAAERSASAYKGQATKFRKRASAGTCPCCKRTFKNMAEHMKTQHPDFIKENGNVVPIKPANVA